MKKLLMLATLAAIATGCQTRITAEKHAENVTPIQTVVRVNGEDQIITSNAIISSGGWYATARSPLWATEALSGLELGVQTNGTVFLKLEDYSRDLSTNAVAVTHSLTTCAADIAGKVAAAIVAYYGGGAVSATSSLGSLTFKDIVGKAQAALAKKGVTDATASLVDTSAIANEIASECIGDACKDCSGGSCTPK